MLVPAPREDLCLAFANTRYWRGSETQTEQLQDVAALLDWAAKSGGAAAETVTALRRLARDRAPQATAIFFDAIAIREAIYLAFSALASDAHIRDEDFAVLNSAIAAAPARTQLARSNGGYAWRIDRAGASAAALLAPVLWSAADLMVKADTQRIRQCANEKCLWLFLDESKNGTRRWCDMSSCGNRAKARRHYLKTKQE